MSAQEHANASAAAAASFKSALLNVLRSPFSDSTSKLRFASCPLQVRKVHIRIRLFSSEVLDKQM
jgi:hypothetical protein